MAAGLTAQYAAISSSPFQNSCEMAAVTAAISISAEATSVVDHVNRVALAKAVLNAPANWRAVFAEALASQGIDSTSTDAAINTGIASVWNAIAGVP
jgi:hypothetical protein